MIIDYKEFLPSALRSTRWGEFIEAFQSLIEDDFIPDKIEYIFNQFDIEEATEEQLVDLAYRLGFELSILTGYTSTTDYLQKEIRTIVARIKSKATRGGYRNINYIFVEAKKWKWCKNEMV